MRPSLSARRILLTQSGDFMGPAICEALRDAGAEVVESAVGLVEPEAAARAVEAAGAIDALVANLAVRAPATPALEVGEHEWRATFAALDQLKTKEQYQELRGVQL